MAAINAGARVRALSIALLLLCFAGMSAGASEISCKKAMQDFLASPNSATKTSLVRSAPDACWTEVAKREDSFLKLAAFVASGNSSAAEYMAEHLSSTDGGNLEDALVSLGLYSDKDMRRFMALAANKRISDTQFVSAIAALPLSLTDDFPAQLAAVLERRRAVSRVSDQNLSRFRTLALEALDKRAAEIRAADALARKGAGK